jgi:serine/threonine protein kinase
MGVVYRAHDELLRRDVAVKVVKKDPQLDSSTSQNLLHEARASSSLSHPNICTIHDVGESDGDLYIVMELVEGKPLHALISGTGLPPESVMRYGVQIASALARAHDRGIVHRDLKTANIVVTAEGLVKVLDFGLAKRVGGGILDAPTMTFSIAQGASSLSGTLPYMAPEILRGDPADERSDLWALGVVLYEAASGRLPFEGRTGFEISSSIMREIPKPLGPPVSPGLWSIVQRCLSKEPLQRYQRAGEIQAALEAVQSGAILSADTGPDPNSPPRTTTLHSVRHIPVKKGDVLLLVGTVKGAFILRSNAQRSRWEVGGPYFHGHNVYALAYDDRGGQSRIWASTSNFWGTLLRSSDDFGRSWTNPPQAPIRFPADAGMSLKNIWQITVGPKDEPNILYCGVEPAALFETRDGGETWSMVRGLFDHPHRPRWLPGNGGLALHSVILDPSNKQRIYVAISSGGVYRTDDGGSSWTAQNRGIRAIFMPDKYPEFGQCVHKIALHPSRPERLYLQNHWGIYRTDNAGERWIDIANGVPSDFGFPILVHPHNPDCAFVIPVDSDEFRCSCDGRLRVFRTRNAGESWEQLGRGLPQKQSYETVLRDAMTTDSLDPAGIFFGTRSGQLFGSRDEGKHWQRILEGLPSIVCVRCAMVGDGGRSTASTSPKLLNSKRSATPSQKSRRATNFGTSRATKR